MKKLNLLFGCMLLFAASFAQYTYPVAPEGKERIEQFGQSIPDPYRFMENLDSPEIKDWIEQQKKLVEKYRHSIFGYYNLVERNLAFSYVEATNKSYGNKKIGPYYFSTHYAFDHDPSPIIVFKKKLSYGWDDLVNTAQFLRNKDDQIGINGVDVSDDGLLISISLNHKGSDWQDIRIIEAATKKVLNDKVEWTKDNIIWCGSGFVYRQFECPGGSNEISSLVTNSAIFYHRVGTNAKEDIVLSNYNENNKIAYQAGEDDFLILYEAKTMNGKKLGALSFIKTNKIGVDSVHPFLFLPGLEAGAIDIIGEHNGKFLALTRYKSPRGRIMMYDYNQVNQGKELIEMFSQNLLQARFLKGKIICTYMDGGNNLLLAFDVSGKLIKRIDVPAASSITGFNRTVRDSITYYYVNTYTSPTVTLKFNLNSMQSSLPEDGAEFNLHTGTTTDIVTYRSADSTEIVMYLIHKDNIKLNGNNPVLLYAYGGFGLAERPQFNFMYEMMVKGGAVVAIPLIRGGGEFGEEWHNAGRKQNKQKSVDDVIGAVEWLVDNKYTNRTRVALTGGSQGGWLMAEAMVQRPELFKVVVPRAGIYDLLRFHKYSITGSIGYDEFGNPEDSTEFQYLKNISPYHQVKEGVTYPACMIITGANDDRVVPFHSYKLAAMLQKNRNGEIPYLLYVEDDAGHNVSDSHDGFQQMALMYAFIMRYLQMPAIY